MRNGIFLKLMAAFAVVILATAVTFDAMLGGAARLAYPLSDVEAVSLQIRQRLELASVVAFLFALVVAAIAANWTARRLERIVDVAGRIADGDLQARIQETSQDEVGRVASAIGDHVRVMDDGRIVHRGMMGALAADQALQQRLLGLSLDAHQ